MSRNSPWVSRWRVRYLVSPKLVKLLRLHGGWKGFANGILPIGLRGRRSRDYLLSSSTFYKVTKVPFRTPEVPRITPFFLYSWFFWFLCRDLTKSAGSEDRQYFLKFFPRLLYKRVVIGTLKSRCSGCMNVDAVRDPRSRVGYRMGKWDS